MKFGINLLNFGPGAGPEMFERWVRLGEALGYHFVTISDHVVNTPDVERNYPAPFYDPFVTLGWLAALTDRLELGTSVALVPHRHPLQVARMVANLDRLSGGRLILGIGLGWARQEFDALGIPFERRGALADDYLAAMKAFWTNDVASYEGRFVSFRDVHTAPRPVRQPHPPIWVAGKSEAAFRRAVRFGDGWHPLEFRVDWVRDVGLPRLRAVAEAEGKPAPAFCPRIKLKLTAQPLPDDERLAGQGTLDQVRADIETLAELGATYLVFDPYMKDPEITRHPEKAWAALATLAERVLDLDRGTLR